MKRRSRREERKEKREAGGSSTNLPFAFGGAIPETNMSPLLSSRFSLLAL
jgi:hypothetical protein